MKIYNFYTTTKSIIEKKNLSENAILYSELINLQSDILDIGIKIIDKDYIHPEIKQKINNIKGQIFNLKDSIVHQEKIKSNVTCEEIIGKILFVLNENEDSLHVFRDKSIDVLKVKDIKLIVDLYDSLNEENQEKMKFLMDSSSKGYHTILKFCEEYFK